MNETLPVLTLSDADAEARSSLVLPNEIIVSFEADLSNSQVQTLLNRYGLEVIRPLRFTQNRYLVRSNRDRGTAILNVANQLNGQTGIQSATPNFIQALSQQQEQSDTGNPPASYLQQMLAGLPAIDAPYQSDLLPLAWHLNSTARRGNSLPRTDIHATEAWAEGNGGEGTTVAVIDSVIQWDHPDLAQNVATVETSDREALPAGYRLPGEVHGWDFTSDRTACAQTESDCVTGDPDTRLSNEELAILRPRLQDSFRLSDADLLEKYKDLAEKAKFYLPDSSDRQLASVVRKWIQGDVASEFHGTWTSGVIAAHPQNGQGAIGVAPNAKILPVRVFGLGGEITSARLIEAIGYAAERNVDVINLSLGGLMPDQELTDQMFHVMDSHPDLAIVAAAGNESLDGVAFPAAIPGVISVGATNLDGKRTPYSSYGGRLDVVAPGGDTSIVSSGGILTTGGTWLPDFWQGMTAPDRLWSVALDPIGKYVQVQGTSFAAPTVAGVVALMKGENPHLSRDRVAAILKNTASYDSLTLSAGDRNYYRLQSQVGLTMLQDRLSGVFPIPQPITAEQYFFGSGLVNAEAAIEQAHR